MNESLSWCRTDRRLNQWAPALLALFLSSPMPPAAADPLRTPKSEARVLMEEGVRHYQQHVAEAALAELDHAELLGDQTPDLFAARIPLLCQAALGPKKAERGQEDEPLPDDGPIDERVRLILRAIADDDRYQRDNLEAGLEIFDDSGTMEGRSYELRNTVSKAASKVLELLERTKNPQAAGLRTRLCSFLNFDPLQGKMPRDWETPIANADLWSSSLEEQLTYYRLLCTTYPWAAYGGWRLRVSLSPTGFCARFLDTPEKQKAAYFEFLQSLVKDPVSRPAGLLYLAEHAEPEAKEAACRALYDDLWEERAELLRTRRLVYLLKYAMELEAERKAAVADPKLVALLHYELQHETRIVDATVGIWNPELFPPEEAASLWKDFDVFEKNTHSRGDNYPVRMRESYVQRFGLPEAAPPALPVLEVKRFWDPATLTVPFQSGFSQYEADDHGFWTVGLVSRRSQQCAIFHTRVDADAAEPFKIEPAPLPPIGYLRNMAVTPEAVYLLGGRSDKETIERFDLATRTWSTHEIAHGERIYYAAGQLYVFVHGPADECGLGRYNPQTGELTMVAHSRRRPAQNAYDDGPAFRFQHVFSGPGNRPGVIADFSTYYIKEGPGAWEPLLNTSWLMKARQSHGRTLLHGINHTGGEHDVAVMLDPAQAEPKLWLGPANPGPVEKAKTGRKPAPPDVLPMWAEKPVWRAPRGHEFHAESYGFHDERLFAMYFDRVLNRAELLCYQPGHANALRVPIRFATSPAMADAMKAAPVKGAMITRADHRPREISFQTTTGLCLAAKTGAVWFLPFAELEAYLNAHDGDFPPDEVRPDADFQEEVDDRVSSFDDPDSFGDVIDPSAPDSFR